MGESLDIIRFIDGMWYGTPRLLASDTGAAAKFVKTLKPSQRILCRPRILQMPIFDWGKPQDIEYAKSKYTKQGFNYEEAMKQSDEMKRVASQRLAELSRSDLIAHSSRTFDHPCNPWKWNEDDIILLPELRTLTCCKGIDWPENVRAYIDAAFERCRAKPYFADAVE